MPLFVLSVAATGQQLLFDLRSKRTTSLHPDLKERIIKDESEILIAKNQFVQNSERLV